MAVAERMGMKMKTRWSDSEIEQALKEAKASLAVEGLYTTSEEDELIRKKLRGEISHDEFLRRALELATKS